MEAIHTALNQIKTIGNNELSEGRCAAASLVYNVGVELVWNEMLLQCVDSYRSVVPLSLRSIANHNVMHHISLIYSGKRKLEEETGMATDARLIETQPLWEAAVTHHIEVRYSKPIAATSNLLLRSIVTKIAAAISQMFLDIVSELQRAAGLAPSLALSQAALQCDPIPVGDIHLLFRNFTWLAEDELRGGAVNDSKTAGEEKENRECGPVDHQHASAGTQAASQCSSWSLKPPVVSAPLLGAVMALKSNCSMALQCWLEQEAQRSLLLEGRGKRLFLFRTQQLVVPLILQTILCASTVTHCINAYVHDHGTALQQCVDTLLSNPHVDVATLPKKEVAILWRGNADSLAFLVNLYLKASFRQGRMYEWLAILEEGQMLEECIGDGEGFSSGKAKPLSHYAGQTCQRWFQWRLKAWNTARDAAVVSTEILHCYTDIKASVERHTDKDLIHSKLRQLVSDDESTTEDSDKGATILPFLISSSQQSLMRQQSEIAGEANRLRLALLPPKSASSASHLEAYSTKVMPFSSPIHGVGIIAVDNIEEGEALIVETPIAKSSIEANNRKTAKALDEEQEVGSYQDRFATAVKGLKALVDLAKMEARTWFKKLAASGLSPTGAVRGDVLLAALLPYAPAPLSPVGKSVRVAPIPGSLFALLSLFALHHGNAVEAAEVAAIDVEDVVLCGAWHNNAMRIDEVDFRVGSGSLSDTFNGSSGLSGDPGSGLYIAASRFNHSHIHPNAICVFDHLVTGHLTVRALTKIPVGKEIFISYAPIIGSYLQRKKHLRFPVRDFKKKSSDKPQKTLDVDDQGGAEALRLDQQLPVNVDEVVLLEDEEETTEDVLAPHMYGQEQLTCPKCGIDIEGRRESDSIKIFTCKVCKTPIPIADYYQKICERRDQAIAWCGEGSPEMRTKALKLLLGVEDGAKMLHVHHFLRFQIRLEALAAGVGANLTLELSQKLVELSKQLAERAESVCPDGWPLTTGLRMHYIYALGRHRIGVNEGLSLVELLTKTKQAVAAAASRSSQAVLGGGVTESSGGAVGSGSLAEKRERLKQRRKEKREGKKSEHADPETTTKEAPPASKADLAVADTSSSCAPTAYTTGPDGKKIAVDLPTGLNVPEEAEDVNVTVLRYLFLSVQDHLNQYGQEAAMQRFFARYTAELEAIDIRGPADLENALTVAGTIL